MLKALLMIGVATVAIAGGGFYLVERATPSYGDIVRTCMEREAELPPAHRLTTCTCFSTEVAGAFWTAREMVLTAARSEGLKEVALNGCRARSFEQLPGDRGPTRMSPMPKLTN